jgi:hypothetical protein
MAYFWYDDTHFFPPPAFGYLDGNSRGDSRVHPGVKSRGVDFLSFFSSY